MYGVEWPTHYPGYLWVRALLERGKNGNYPDNSTFGQIHRIKTEAQNLSLAFEPYITEDTHGVKVDSKDQADAILAAVNSYGWNRTSELDS